jgi:hypothetical protein
MPRLMQMGTIVERARQRADKVHDDHIEEAEWKSYVDEVYSTLIYSVAARPGMRYFEYVESLTTTGAAYVEEPDDLFSVIRVDYLASSTDRRRLISLKSSEEPPLAAMTGTEPVYYSLIDDRIYLFPTPATGKTIEMLYVPQPPDLSDYADDDLVDVVTPDGAAALIWGVAALARAKASQDVQFHTAKSEHHSSILLEWAAERLMGEGGRFAAPTDVVPSMRDPGDYL